MAHRVDSFTNEMFKDTSKICFTHCQFFLHFKEASTEYHNKLLIRTQIFYSVLLDSSAHLCQVSLSRNAGLEP